MQLEKDLEKKIVRYAKTNDILVYKFTSPGQVGVPDRLFLASGYCLFLEIKRNGKRPTKIQEFHIRKIREAGHLADWVDNFEDAKICLDALLSLQGTSTCPKTLLPER